VLVVELELKLRGLIRNNLRKKKDIWKNKVCSVQPQGCWSSFFLKENRRGKPY
jgi:hypothetical protein